MCARFLSFLLWLYIGRVHGDISGCTVLGEVHPASAQNKSLISDTDNSNKTFVFIMHSWLYHVYRQIPKLILYYSTTI